MHQSLSGTLGYPPHGDITGKAFDVWKSWLGYSEGNFYMDGDESNRGFLPIAPGQCKTFGRTGVPGDGQITSFEGQKTYSFNYSEMTVYSMSSGGKIVFLRSVKGMGARYLCWQGSTSTTVSTCVVCVSAPVVPPCQCPLCPCVGVEVLSCSAVGGISDLFNIFRSKF